MEHETMQRRSDATSRHMGVKSYSQVISAFRAQGDLTEDQLAILPALQNSFGITRERHVGEIKRALYDEQLSDIATSINPSSTTTNWEIEAGYMCPTVVHRPPHTKDVQLIEQVLKTVPPTTIVKYPQSKVAAKLNNDLQELVSDELKQDGIQNATQQQPSSISVKQSLPNTDVNSSNVVRLVRAKQPTKRKTSLDALIEVVQKELLRANEQTNISNSTAHYSHIRSVSSSKNQSPLLTPHRSVISSVLPPSHITSVTSPTNPSFKLTHHKHVIDNLHITRHYTSQRQRNRSYNDDINHFTEKTSVGYSEDNMEADPENIEEIVRDTVDKLVALTILNNAPFIVNMRPAVPNSDSSPHADGKILTNTLPTSHVSITKSPSMGSQKLDYYRTHDFSLHSSTANEVRSSVQQTSPMKQQPQQPVHHPQLIIQPTANPTSTIQGAPTLFVTPRLFNIQTVVPKPTTNIQIGNTKIILVSPSNITQHLPHPTTSVQPTVNTNPQQQNVINNSPVKLVKFATTTPNNNNNNNVQIPARSTAIPLNTSQTSTLTLPKNVQIVIPSQTPSTIQLTRKHSDESNKPLSTAATTFRPVTTVPMTLTTCAVDQIPQAAQEVTITTSPTSSPPLTSTLIDHSQHTPLGTTIDHVGSALSVQQQQPLSNLTTIRTSPTHDETIKSLTVNFQPKAQPMPRPPLTHGPMIYRMTSVNPSVPVFRVRATANPTSTTVMSKSIKTDTKPMSMTTTANMCYEPTPAHTTPTTSGSVSVLACFKTTKKRNKERAIMPRPSTTDSNDVSQELQQRLTTIINTSSSPVVSNDTNNSNSSSDFRQLSPSTPTRLIQQTSLSSTLSDENTSTMLSPSLQEQNNDITTSSSNSIPISRHSSVHLDHNLKTITTPNTSPSASPMHSLHSTPKPVADDRSIQCVNDRSQSENEELSVEQDEMTTIDVSNKITDFEIKKRSIDDISSDNDNWIITAENLLQTMHLQKDYDLLDVNCQKDLSMKLDALQINLQDGKLSSVDQFYNAFFDIKQDLLNSDVWKCSLNNIENLFHYFESEFTKVCDPVTAYKKCRQE